ncbi:MAG: efflux RND transporter permease subunit, partial [Verrucomicrobiae bacterium]|nr:efflux RND transporter permease subunit [Verrucomicrobiae bacterium]
MREAFAEVARPVAFGVGIILIVFLPILTLEGIEGKLFKPMALTMIFALLGSLLLALTLVPVLASLALDGSWRWRTPVAQISNLPYRGCSTRWLARVIRKLCRLEIGDTAGWKPALPRMAEREPWLVRSARRLYAPILDLALRFRAVTVLAALAVLAGAVFLASRLGGEFLPRLGEGALAISTVRLAGISVDEAVAWNDRIEKTLLAEFPDEIAHVWSRLGTAE